MLATSLLKLLLFVLARVAFAPPVDRNAIRELVAQSMPVTHIATRLGCTRQWIHTIMREEGIQSFTASRRSRNSSEQVLCACVTNVVTLRGHEYGVKMIQGALRQKYPQFVFTVPASSTDT